MATVFFNGTKYDFNVKIENEKKSDVSSLIIFI